MLLPLWDSRAKSDEKHGLGTDLHCWFGPLTRGVDEAHPCKRVGKGSARQATGEGRKGIDRRTSRIPCSALLDCLPYDAKRVRLTSIGRDLSHQESTPLPSPVFVNAMVLFSVLAYIGLLTKDLEENRTRQGLLPPNTQCFTHTYPYNLSG
jgi:hypothetical protein